MLDTVKML